MFPKYWSKLFEDEDLKTTENQRLGPEGRHNAPWAWKLHFIRLRNFLCALCICSAPPCMQKVGMKLSFPASVLGKARTFSPNPSRNSHYKYQPSSFRISRSELEKFKRKATLELWESFYLLLDFLGYFFIFSNLVLVTICN